jgi:hypothetical protein
VTVGPEIAPDSKAFLISLFTDLRNDLADQADAGGPSGPDPETVARVTAIFDALLTGLTGVGDFPDDERVREYVAELAKATDEDNEYGRVACEHRALAELSEALARNG